MRMIDPAKGCRRMIALNIYVDTFDHMIRGCHENLRLRQPIKELCLFFFILVKLLCVVYHFGPLGREVYEISINCAPVKPAVVPYYLFQLVLGKKQLELGGYLKFLHNRQLQKLALGFEAHLSQVCDFVFAFYHFMFFFRW